MSADINYEEDIEKFQYFIFEMDDVLDEFIALARENRFELDYSISNLDTLESFIDSIEGSVRDDKFINRCSRYLGEVFRKELGGRWDLCLDDPENINFKLPIINDFSDLDLEFCPIAIINNYLVTKRSGLLKGAVNSNAEFVKPNKTSNGS